MRKLHYFDILWIVVDLLWTCCGLVDVTLPSARSDVADLLQAFDLSYNAQGGVTSRSLWSRYYSHFVGITCHNALS